MKKIIIISSPSGAGKTTICKKLLAKKKNIELSISFTTRAKRNKETEGKDYFFVRNISYYMVTPATSFCGAESKRKSCRG